MIPKGIGDIRTSQTIKTRPGPLTEESLLLRLYKLASQKANFQKKKEWAERQRFQAIRHLIDVQGQISMLKKLAMVKIGSSANPGKAEAIKTESDLVKTGRGKKWSEFPLKY